MNSDLQQIVANQSSSEVYQLERFISYRSLSGIESEDRIEYRVRDRMELKISDESSAKGKETGNEERRPFLSVPKESNCSEAILILETKCYIFRLFW